MWVVNTHQTCSDAAAAQQGDDLGFQLREGHRAKIAAVLGLGAVIAKDEDAAFRHRVGVLQRVLCVGGVEDLAALGGAVHHQSAGRVQIDEVVLPCQDAAHPQLAACAVEHHVVFGVDALLAVSVDMKELISDENERSAK